MDVDEAALKVRDVARRLHWYAVEYVGHRSAEKRTHQKRKMMRRRIAELREWLTYIEEKLEEEEKGSS